MLQVNRIDVKTGLALQEKIEGQQQPKTEQIDHSYLEHWLNTHGLEAQFYKGKFYDGVNDSDRLRLEAEGKVLAFTNGKAGYFTDAETARLMTLGDTSRNIAPIYAGDRNSPHNLVAYGSLVASDGIASTSVSFVRVLVIDDQNRSHGDETLFDKSGQPVSPQQLASIYNKMGDGIMLVPQTVMQDLITPKARDEITARVFEKAGISTDITALAQDVAQVDVADELAERMIAAKANRTVAQFRAATPDLPGLIKGTMASSKWCDRLGVDAIISNNDIKGDDGRLSRPGIKTVSSLWINRKSDGRYGEQVVGPQVKGCIREATLHELNPQMKAQAEELAEVAADPVRLGQHYVERKEQQRNRIEESFDSEEEAQPARPDWLFDVLKADKYKQLSEFSKVNKALSRDLKDKWLDNALSGIYVPSAMAQHHSQLKPWEVCNKDLPHGAVVAYYRSPFPNVGAAAIAINNTDIIKEKDREAFSKHGVAYLPPWTAKNIAITDFDGDANGFFVGYEATVPDLPQQLRQQLASAQAQPPAQQYEAGRTLLEQMVHQLEQGKENRISPAAYPLAVKEFIERTAPDVRPPEITKHKKEKHPWHEGKSHSEATWQAWGITADNPTGKVANLSMTLRALASEMTYAPPEQKESILRSASAHYNKQFFVGIKAGGKNLPIPTDEYLQAQGLSSYGFKERIRTIAQTGAKLGKFRNAESRAQFVEDSLELTAQLLTDIVDGPSAVNLQTAVDTAKSCRGIDESFHIFAKALQYKPDLIREHQRDPDNYVGTKTLPTNTQEPIAWGVEAVNRLYEDIKLPERENKAFKDIFPKSCTPEQETRALKIARTYNSLIALRRAARDQLRERRPEDQMPTLLITAPSGRELVLQNILDPEGTLPIWRAEGVQPDWKIAIKCEVNDKAGNVSFPAQLTFTDANGEACTQSIGEVSAESAAQHNLEGRLQATDKPITISSPQAQIRVPFAQENDADELIARAVDYAQTSVEQIPKEERSAYLSALWRQFDGMGFALKHFTEEVCDRLQTIPEIKLTGIQQSVNEVGQISPGEYTARFSQYSYEKADGTIKTSPSIALVADDGSEQQFGTIDPRSVQLPQGASVQAHIEIDESGKTARMQVLDLVALPEPPLAALPEPLPEQSLAIKPPSNLIEFPTESASQLDLPMAAEASAVYNASPPDDEIYSPSRQELRQWCAVAMASGDEPLKTQIVAKGQQLKALYGDESGTPGAEPPLEYRHPQLVLSAGDRQQMQQDIAAARAVLQAMSETVQPPDQRPQYAQLEVG